MKTARKYFRPKWQPGEAATHWDIITEALNYGQPMTCDGRYSRRQVEDAIYRAFQRRAEANLTAGTTLEIGGRDQRVGKGKRYQLGGDR